MFGATNTFGGGGFGQPQQQQQQGAFGSTPFGGGGGFGQQQQQQPGGFGSTPFGGNTGGGFGQPQQQGSSLFGGGGGGFGQQPQQNTAFGATNTFGTPAPAQGGLFGSAPAPSTFGAAPAPFGSTGGGLFGSNTAATPASGGLFGSTSNTTPFGGGTSTFGSNTGGGFGSTFGAPAPATTFGAPAPTPGLFGAPTPAPAPFGAPAPAAGGLFGSPAPAPGLFGAPAAPQPGQGGGTRGAQWQPTSRQDGTTTINLQALSAMQQYEQFSAEELRFQDYQQGNRGSSTPTAGNTGGGFGGFGAPAPAPAFGAPAPGGLFGSTPAPAPFGAPATGLFGSTPAPAPFGAPAPAPFGAPAPATGGLFGSTPAPAPFGAPAGGLFGSTPAPAPFGAPATGGLFGSTPAPAPFGAPAPAPFGAPAPAPFGAPSPATGGLFGTPAPAPAFGGFGAAPAPATGGLFGSSPAPAPFGAPAPAFGFGAKPPGTSVFGAPAPAAPAPFGIFGAFGAPAPAPFGAPAAPAPLFGAPAPAPPFALTAAPQPQAPMAPPNFNIVPPQSTEVLANHIRSLEQQRKEIEKTEVWGKPKDWSGGSTPTTPQSLSASKTASLAIGSPSQFSYAPYNSFSPSSASKIRPRGYPKTEPAKKATSTSLSVFGGHDNTATKGPEAQLRSAATNLVVQPGSLRVKPKRLILEPASPAPPSAPDVGANTETPNVSTRPPTGSPSPTFHEEITSPPVEEDGFAHGASDPVTTPAPRLSSHGKPRSTTKSPGQEYYQRVIGSVDGDSLAHTSPLTNGGKTEAAMVPKLTKNGYIVSPSLEELSAMSPADLAAVEGFAVSRECYGMIEWEGAVDVRGADLDEIIEIQQNDIMVYHEIDNPNFTKPKEGSKLNRPAVLTFYGVFPKAGPNATQEEKDKMRRNLERSSRKSGATFLDYNDQIGEWKIRVQHFSRYGLFDDDSDEEDTADLEEEASQVHTKTQSLVRKQYRTATPFTSSRFAAVFPDEGAEASESQDADELEKESAVRMSETEILASVRANADQAYREVFDSMQAEAQLPDDSVMAEEESRIILDDEGEDEEFEEDLARTRTSARYSIRGIVPPTTSTCRSMAAASGVAASSVDAGLRMGRSFRVGWLPSGSFLKLDTTGSRLTQCKPALSEERVVENSKELLQAQLDCAERAKAQKDACPTFSLPRGRGNSGSADSNEQLHKMLQKFGDVGIKNQDAAPAFPLLSSLLTAQEGNNSSALVVRGSTGKLVADPHQLSDAVSQWLTTICAAEAQTEIEQASSRDDQLGAIFAALSGGDTNKACEIAARAGCYRLIAVLSSAGTGASADVLKQVLDLNEQGKAYEVASQVMRCLKDLGGDPYFENELSRNGRNELGWRRRLAIRMKQKPDEPLDQVLSGYDSSTRTGEAPFPMPHYAASGTKERSLLYKLLKGLGSTSVVDLSDIVDPRGFTASHHDNALSFHLASALVAVSGSHRLSALTSEAMMDSYEAQLVSQGFWEWAVFVALNMLGEVDEPTRQFKLHRARDLVLRHFNEEEASMWDKRKFLRERVGVPNKWFEEALAHRSAYAGKHYQYLEHALYVDVERNVRDIEEVFLPHVFFMKKDSVGELTEKLKQTASGAGPDALVYAMDSLFRLVRELEDLSIKSTQELESELPEFLEVADDVQHILDQHRARPARAKSLQVSPLANSSRLPEMISESLKYLLLVKSKLDILASKAGIPR